MEGVAEFVGDTSLTRDDSGSWINYVSVGILSNWIICRVLFMNSLVALIRRKWASIWQLYQTFPLEVV